MLLGVLVVILTAASALPASRESVPDSGSAARTDARSLWQTPRFLVIAIIALLYGWQEGIFQNWGIILLREEKGIPPATAALALTTFWMTATAGRILVSLLLLRFRPGTIWRILPFVIGASFLAIPRSAGPLTGVVLFALAGLGCSAFFPLTVAIGTRAFADRESLAASGLIVMLVAGNSGGTFVYGALRGWLSLGTLYQCSALLTGIMLLFIGLAAASSTSPPAPSRRH
jgi:fucose permease